MNWDLTAISLRKMSCVGPFLHGGTYRISSVEDGNVLDVSARETKPGTKIISSDWIGGGNQKWIVKIEGSGYRLEPNLPAKQKSVLDLNVERQEVILFGFHGNPNQQWIAERVPYGSGAVFLTNLQTRTCLTNMGHGKQIVCRPKDAADKSMWWYVNLA